MTHSDDQGLVLPPNLAPTQVVIVPIYKGDEQLAQISEVANSIVHDLRAAGVTVKFDDRDTFRPGAKFAQYELQGVPLRIAIGPKDIANNQVEIARRDNLSKTTVPNENLAEHVTSLLTQIQNELYAKALDYRNTHITEANSFEEFKEILETKGGFISAHWDGTAETESKIKDLTKATIRCIPFNSKEESGNCILTGSASNKRVLFAKAY